MNLDQADPELPALPNRKRQDDLVLDTAGIDPSASDTGIDIPARSIAVGSPARVIQQWSDENDGWVRTEDQAAP